MVDNRMGAEETIAAREATDRQGGGDERAILKMRKVTSRIGAVALPLGIILFFVSTSFHPAKEDPMDNPAVLMEYAQSDSWIAVHLAQFFAVLLLIGGLVALYYSITAKPGVGAVLSRFGLASAVTTATSFTILQAVDAWASAPAAQEGAYFAAAEAVRWTEIGVNGLSFFLLGLTLFLYGLALALGSVYPRWAGWVAVISGAGFMYHGAGVVPYKGFVTSISNIVGLLLLTVWAFIMAVLMWRGSRQSVTPPEAAAPMPPQRPAHTG